MNTEGGVKKILILIKAASHVASAAALLICSASSAADIGRDLQGCIPDRSTRLSLDLQRFDQKADGWRGVESKAPECALPAADLIAEYRKAKPEVLDDFGSYLLYWHEGQIRASHGQYNQAAKLFNKSRLPSPKFEMWNLYVDATLAFLDKDLPALQKARTALAALSPEVYKPLPKPLNLDVVDALVRCIDRPYSEAYGDCRPNVKPK